MESQKFDHCPHCNTKIKSSVFGTPVILFSERGTRLVNEYVEIKQLGYCSKCGDGLYKQALSLAKEEYKQLKNKTTTVLKLMPVVTLQQPYNWQYTVVRMLTAQSTLGTGVFTDVVTSFTDMVGGESSRYNEKLKSAENNCFTQLRLQALDAGATAVIGADIDYSEMGGAKSMVVVCMSGTAIKLINPEVVSKEYADNIENLPEDIKRMNELQYLTTE